MREPGCTGRRRRALHAFAFASLLIWGTPAAASRFPHNPDLERGGARSPRYKVIAVDWQRPLTERGLLEYRPREPAGPVLDSLTGEVAVATRNGILRLYNRKGIEIWETDLDAAPTSTPALTVEAIYVGTADGRLHAIDRFNGEPLWAQPMGAQVLAPAVPGPNAIFVGTDQDAVHALDPISGEALWVYRRSTGQALSVRGGSAVSYANGKVYAGFSDGATVALSAEDGRLIWEAGGVGSSVRRLPDADATPIVKGGVVYSAVFNDGVYAFDAETGALKWRTDAQGAHSLSLAGDLLLVGGANKARALKVASGALEWSVDLGESYVTRPVVAGKLVLLAGPKGILVVSRDTGRPLGRFHPGSGFSAPPAASGTSVYALSNLGFFYRLSLVVETG